MSDDETRTPGPGWWIASDGVLYPPEDHPDTRALLEATTGPAEGVRPGPDPSSGNGASRSGPSAAASTAQRLMDAARTGAQHLSDRPTIGETRSVEPPDDDLGGSLHWASSALRRHLGTLAGVSLLAIVLGAVGLLVTIGLEIGVASLEWASLTAITSLVMRLAQLCVVAWVLVVLVRTWRLIVDEQPVDFAAVFTLSGLLPTLITVVLVAPIMFVTGGAAVSFAIVALLLTTHTNLSPFAAIGRMLSDTCSSAKRFFQTLLIGVLFALFSMAISVVSTALFVQVTTGAALASISNAFGESSELRETDANVTMVGGTLLTAVVALGLGLVLWNMIGLWTAAYAHRLRLAGPPRST